jgi:phenylacetate-CoA ligase
LLLFRDHYRVALTSGTTGLRDVFLSNPAEWVTVLALNTFQPDSLVAYTSMARLLAGDEVLPPEAARRIEQAWGVRPFNVYGATETAGIASEYTRHTGLHLYEDLVITEAVDEKNRPVRGC